jgi:uncharacterized protein YaaN involved in tellurite resistance
MDEIKRLALWSRPKSALMGIIFSMDMENAKLKSDITALRELYGRRCDNILQLEKEVAQLKRSKSALSGWYTKKTKEKP